MEPSIPNAFAASEHALGEGDILSLLQSAWREISPPAPAGPGDDAAVLVGGEVVTIDTLVEGVHFDGRLSAEDVGWKTLAVSVSDCAAMGARPAWAVLSMSLPKGTPRIWVEGFARGLRDAALRYGVTIVGGDTTGSPGPKMTSLTLTGRALAAPWLRTGAIAGDGLWITGWPGLAGRGWMDEAPPEAALAALRRPQPPLEFALAMARRGGVHAAMDLSDGLASDLPKLCGAVAALVDDDALPIHEALGQDDPLRYVYRGGDDYQLLIAASPDAESALRREADRHGVPVHRIGWFEAGQGPRRSSGAPWPSPGFDHFRASP